MRASIYIYYPVQPQAAPQVRSAVEELQRVLLAKSGVAGRLLRRLEGPDTWMEVYEHVTDADAFLALLQSECERLGLEGLLGNSRHTEVFGPL